MVKSIYTYLIAFLLFYSCSQDKVVKVYKGADILQTYQCQDGNDTMNSQVSVFYKHNLYSEYNLQEGRIHGTVYDYFSDGSVKILTHYQHGKAHGMNKVYNNLDVLLRQSMYIENKQVLFESLMIDSVYGMKRRRITSIIGKDHFFGGELILNAKDSIIRGVYAKIVIPDTITYGVEYTFMIDLISTLDFKNPELIIGEFDTYLNCIDTTMYLQLDDFNSNFSYKYSPRKKGYNFIIGYYNVINHERIFFFNDFYVI